MRVGEHREDLVWRARLLARLSVIALVAVGSFFWFVQIVRYPLFMRVGAGLFADYERDHARRTAWVVGIPMLVERAATIATAAILGGLLAWLGLALLVIIWFSTGFLQVPAHRRLQRGFGAVIHCRLVATRVRAAAESTRAVSTILLLMPPR